MAPSSACIPLKRAAMHIPWTNGEDKDKNKDRYITNAENFQKNTSSNPKRKMPRETILTGKQITRTPKPTNQRGQNGMVTTLFERLAKMERTSRRKITATRMRSRKYVIGESTTKETR